MDRSISALFSILEDQGKKTVIAIDEFQQIVNYPEKNCDAWFRTIMQQLQNVVFIFSGSQQSIMTDLFTNPKKPFFRSTAILELHALDKAIYNQFIIEQFASRKRDISKEVVDEILDWTLVHTYYTQQLCERVYKSGIRKISSETWKHEALQAMKEQESVFFNFRELLTVHQWKLLKAIGNKTHVYSAT